MSPAPSGGRDKGRQRAAGSSSATKYASAADVRYRPHGDNALLCYALYEEWKQRCYCCGRPQPFRLIDIDHIVPKSVSTTELADLKLQHDLGADFDLHRPANLAPICKPCNNAKSNNRYRGLAMTNQLTTAARKQDRIIQRVLAAAADSIRSAETVAALQSVRSVPEGLDRIRMLTERMQAFSDTWRPDITTTADGIILRYTPLTAGPASLPPLFDLSAVGPDADEVARALEEVRDYGGELTIDARYLIDPTEDGAPSLADVLGLTGPDDQVVITAGVVQLDPAITFQLALVTAGGAVRDRILLHPELARVGQLAARIILRDPCGVFTAYVQVDRPGPGAMVTTHLVVGRFGGHQPYRLLSTLALFRKAEPTDRLDVRMDNRSLGEPLDTNTTDLGPLFTALRHDFDLVTAIARIQDHTGDRFVLPEEISATERAHLRRAARLLDDGKLIVSVSGPITLTMPPGDIDAILPLTESGELSAWSPHYPITCGPHQIDLGPIAVRVTQLTLTNADELRAAAAAGTTATAQCQVPASKKTITLELPFPGATPETWFALSPHDHPDPGQGKHLPVPDPTNVDSETTPHTPATLEQRDARLNP